MNLNNDELAQAIQATINFINTTTEAKPRYVMLNAHLDFLLTEQKNRAIKRKP